MSNGIIQFQVLDGTSIKLNEKEQYYLLCEAPSQISKSGVMKTPPANVSIPDKSNPGSNSLQWNFSRDIVLTGPLLPDHNLTINLFQKNTIRADTCIAKCTVSLEVLTQGNSIESVSFSLVGINDSTEEFAKARIKIGWREDGLPDGLLSKGGPGATGGLGFSGAGSRESQKPLPDCEGQDFAVRVWFHKAAKLQSLKDDGLYNAMGVAQVMKEKRNTETQKETNEPLFNEEVTFSFTKVKETFWTEPVTISLQNNKLINETIGMVVMDMQTVYRSNPQHFMQRKWFALNKSQTEGNVMGFIKVSVAVLNLRTDAFPEIDDEEDDDEADEAAIANLVSGPGSVFEEVSLYCELIKAEGIPQMDTGMGGSADPYVKLVFGKRTANTVHVKNTLSPEWNTNVVLPLRLPSLTNSILIQIWDYDATSADDLNCSYVLALSDLLHYGEGGAKPQLTARWINFYGHPRPNDADFNSYFKKMSKGEKKGIDYRGRMLLRMEGMRGSTAIPSLPPITETKVEIKFGCQLMQLSMVPDGGMYKVRCSCGTFSASTAPRSTSKMIGSDGSLSAVYFGETVQFSATFSVIAPEDELDAAIQDQIPDLLFQLVEDGTVSKQLGALGAALNPLATGASETEPYASCRFPAKTVLEACTETEVFYRCKAMRRSLDSDDNKEGRPPANPILQIQAGAFISSCTPPHRSVNVEKGLKYWPSNTINETRKEGSKNFILETCVYHAKMIPAGDSTGTSDPFIRVAWANATGQTGAKLETVNPIFNEMVRLVADAHTPFPDVIIELWDWDLIGRNTFLCKTVIPFSETGALGSDEEEVKWFSHFTDAHGRRAEGCSVLIGFRVLKATEATMKDVPERVKMVKKIGKPKDTYFGLPISIDRALPMKKYHVNFSFYGLRHMRKFRLRALQKPTIECDIAGHNICVGTAIGANPDLNVTLTCVLQMPANPAFLPQMVFRVYDNRIGPRVLVGVCAFNTDSDLCSRTKKDAAQREIDAKVMITREKLNAAKQNLLDGLKPTRSETFALNIPDRSGARPWGRDGFKKGLSSTGSGEKRITSSGGLLSPGRRSAPDPDKDHDSASLNEPLIEMPPSPTLRTAEDTTSADAAPGSQDGPSPMTTIEVQPKVTSEEIRGKLDELCTFSLADIHKSLDQEAGVASDASSQISSNAEEELWFDRFDPEGVDAELTSDQVVARLGKLKCLDHGQTTAEDHFGPFDDGESEITFSRGWGKKAVIAGKGSVDVDVRPFSDDDDDLPVTPNPTPTPLANREPLDFLCRVYILNCRNLAAKDDGPLGKASDPYVVMTLSGSSESKDELHVKCKEEGKFQTLNPDFFFMKEMQGHLPTHSDLTITIFDYDKVGFDEEIGSTEIHLGRRWYSRRGYRTNTMVTTTNPFPTMVPGTYTEVRPLRNKAGQYQGEIELWVDMFPISSPSPIPRPIDISPPPPVELEIRCIVWNARDVVLVDNSTIGNEKMTDIYVRCWLDGLRGDMQNTDVHYRSLDGSGNFNWRMNFRCVLEPRTRKIYAIEQKDGMKNKLKNFFSIRKEQKKYSPVMHCQIFDNDLLPGTDDFIGEVKLNLTQVNPVSTRRDKGSLLGSLFTGTTYSCNCWPFKHCPCFKKTPRQLTLRERQELAFKEARDDERAKRKVWEEAADQKLKMIREQQEQQPGEQQYTEEQLKAIRKRLVKDAKKASVHNILENFLPAKRKKKSATATMAQSTAPALAKNANPNVAETPKFWIPCRGPFGGARVGDVQLSFQVVKVEAIDEDKETYAAGKGRSDPQALPEPDRPDSSFFWLSSPWKSAVHILWKNYKWYLFTIICLALLALIVYLWFSTGLETKAKEFFGGDDYEDYNGGGGTNNNNNNVNGGGNGNTGSHMVSSSSGSS